MNFQEIKKNWEAKSRTYELLGDAEPPLRQIRSKHIYSNHLLYFDKDKNENRELRYASNTKSPFVDEQPEKNIRVEQIFFKAGYLFTDKSQVALQQFLAIHPDNGRIFKEVRPEAEAIEEVTNFEERADAYEIVKGLTIDEVAGLMYSEIGDDVFKTSSKELKRDLYVLADSDSNHLLALYNDNSVQLKYLARKAIQFNILKLGDSGRTVLWAKNKRKLLAVPLDKTPYAALADHFLTDDGLEVKAKVIELLKKSE